MAVALPFIMLGMSVLSAKGSMDAGAAQQESANYIAEQEETAAGQERATAQREAIEQRRQARIASSRALAVAGASGAGVTDPTVTNIVGDIAGEGEYRALTALYRGEDRARKLETDAALKRMGGSDAAQASKLEAGSSLLQGGSTLMTRYG